MTQEQLEFLKSACDFAGVSCKVRKGHKCHRVFNKETNGLSVPSWPDLLGAVITYMKSLDSIELHHVPEILDLQIEVLGFQEMVVY